MVLVEFEGDYSGNGDKGKTDKSAAAYADYR